MDEVSNKTLATLLIAAIVISLGGTVISLSKLGQKVTLVNAPTGRANTDIGQAQVSIMESVSIILQTGYDGINFGTGFVNGSIADCLTYGANLTTEGAGTNENDCFTGFSGRDFSDHLGANVETVDFRVENDGTVDVSVAVRGPANTSLLGPGSTSQKEFAWKGSDLEANSCKAALRSTYIDFDSNYTLCDNLTYANTEDTLLVEVKLRFPANQPTGLYSNSSITFYAVKA